MTKPLWKPTADRVSEATVTRFLAALHADWGVTLADTRALYRFSVEAPEKFWVSLKDFAGVIAGTWGETVLADADQMPGARWFPNATLNYAENLLRRRDHADAIVFWGEDTIRRRISHAELYIQVAGLAGALRAAGVNPGDRVAGYMPNTPEAVIGALATHAIGAVWASCSPDFGVAGVLDRFGQIAPKILIASEGYLYNGQVFDQMERIGTIVRGLPSVIETIIVPYTRAQPSLAGIRGGQMLADAIAPYLLEEISFVRRPFNHPLYILFSSGTTGVPKCIVHGAGGTLLKHLAEHLLHCDVKPDDRVFYATTTGWMMWNWQVSALACEATLLLYDGAPFHPDPKTLFDFADAEAMTLFGTSAKYLDAVRKAGLAPIETHRLDTLRTICSTGSPLAPETFDFVYRSIKSDVHLASISGGTDIVGCFVLGDPTLPVWRGEIQTRAFGVAVDVFDDTGQPIRKQKGELVCTKPFPSMPVGFWNDPDGAKYHAAYFERFPGVWHHGDWVELTDHDGMIIYGRSDATLKPGGVRIGTAEIYRPVEQLPEVVESLAIGQDWEDDTRIILFVVLRPGLKLDTSLIEKIKRQIRANATPRHVPARIIQVADIPRTKSGKITELAVRAVVHGQPVKNREALANPEALEHFKDRPELTS